MTEYPIIVFTAFLLLCYGLFSSLSERSIITAPMVFVTIGFFVAFFSLDLLHESINAPYVKIIAEVTLMLVLFADATTLNLKRLVRERRLPMRLLGIGLPLTMILGALIAVALFPEERLWVLILMALILSPTDAALGQAVVTSKDVPEKVRQTINVESGLNDGFALPPILICIAILSEAENLTTTYWLSFVAKQFVYGPVIGGLVGWGAGRLVEYASARGWMNHTFQQLTSLALAILSFTLAEWVHGNGFIATYFAGMFFGTRNEEIRERTRDFGEAISRATVLFIFLLLGAILIPRSFPYWDARAILYAVLSLTLIRMVPVAISLIGSGLSRPIVWFIGWFGPRGIASVLYLLMAIITLGIEGYERIAAIITLTILMSIFLHGITAVPFSRLFKRQKAT